MRDTTVVRRDMGDYLPRYYDDSTVVNNLLDRESTEIGTLNADVYDVLAQFFIDTATWGLAHWERICGLPTDETKPIDQRRAVLKSKLRGIGTVTVALIKNVAEAYTYGEVEVTEDNATYTITVRFVSTLGIPANINDIKNALREIIPAHLDIDYEFTYTAWGELKSAKWGDLKTNTWYEVRTRSWS